LQGAAAQAGWLALQCAGVAQVAMLVHPVCVALQVWSVAPSHLRSPVLHAGMPHWVAAGSHCAALLQVCTKTKSLRASLQRSRFAPLHRYWLAEHAAGLQFLFATSQRAGVAQTLVVDHPVWSGLHVWSSAPLHCI